MLASQSRLLLSVRRRAVRELFSFRDEDANRSCPLAQRAFYRHHFIDIRRGKGKRILWLLQLRRTRDHKGIQSCGEMTN